MNPAEALFIEFDHMDLGPMTIRSYLKELLFTLFAEGESFSGKRPFGNSGWESDLAAPLVKAGCIAGNVDDEGWADVECSDEYDEFIQKMIDAL